MRYPLHTAAACLVAALAAIALTGFFADAGEVGDPAVPTSFVVPLDLRPTWRSAVPMLGNTVTWPARDGLAPRKIEVRLQQTAYSYESTWVREGRVLSGTGWLTCYELLSEETYTWAHCLGPPMPPPTSFALFALDDGTSYLGWAEGLSVTLADVTRPRDRIVAFHERFANKRPPGPPPASIMTLVPGGREWGGPPKQFPDQVQIVALATDGDGRLVLTVKDSLSRAAAALRLEDGEWVLLHNYPDGLPGGFSAPAAKVTGPLGPVVRRLADDDLAIVRAAKVDLLAARSEQVAALIGLVSDEQNLRLRQESVTAATEILGALRATEAADALAAIIAYPYAGAALPDKQQAPMGRGPAAWPWAPGPSNAPAVEALVGIGEPAMPAVLQKLRVTDNPLEQNACLNVLLRVCGRDVTLAMLRDALGSSTDAQAAQRLRRAVDAVENPPQPPPEPEAELFMRLFGQPTEE